MQSFVIITGCSSGIGRCAALTLNQRGYRVIATVRNEDDRLALLAAGIEHVVLLDLASSTSITHAVEECLNISNGKLFALFNNAAYGQPGAVEDLSRDALRQQFEVNLFGTHELTIQLLPTLLQQADARIVQNSSVLGLVAMPMRGAYNASKFALEGLTDTLRLELAGTSVKISLIEPGPILSRFRVNALQAFEQHIDIAASRHSASYHASLARLKKEGPAAPFTLGPEAVVHKLIKALESAAPKHRYYVTIPTYVMAYLKIILPGKILDKILRKF
ncbi:short-subunit dehydrogenase [Alteromonadaceae bacterium 2753L.S.0a.02]|nr:short-subunit dehydrogenase [Alteromonadaceae bacterium 2753L.S.0a.02]